MNTGKVKFRIIKKNMHSSMLLWLFIHRIIASSVFAIACFGWSWCLWRQWKCAGSLSDPIDQSCNLLSTASARSQPASAQGGSAAKHTACPTWSAGGWQSKEILGGCFSEERRVKCSHGCPKQMRIQAQLCSSCYWFMHSSDRFPSRDFSVFYFFTVKHTLCINSKCSASDAQPKC